MRLKKILLRIWVTGIWILCGFVIVGAGIWCTANIKTTIIANIIVNFLVSSLDWRQGTNGCLNSSLPEFSGFHKFVSQIFTIDEDGIGR